MRQLGVIAAALGVLAVLVPAASADITGTVVSGSGAPLSGVTVRATDATGASVTSGYTAGAGTYSLYISTYSPPAFPLAITYEYDDPCLPYGSVALTATQAAAADGAVLPAIGLAAREFCAASAYSFGSTAPPPTAYVDTAGGRVISGAGGIAYLRLAIPYSATGVTVLYNAAPIGGAVAPGNGYNAQITAPAVGGSGPLTASYAIDGVAYTRTLGTLVVIGKITAPPATSSGVDVEVVIDISGSMSGTDPQFLRKDAMRALLGLVSKGDRLGAVAFDEKFEPVFDLQSVTDANSKALGALADQHILNRGGTDYNVGLAKGYEALTAAAVYSATRPKYVIFLTDGAHNGGDYNNTHLLMAANPTGRPWPVCAVQLGSQAFQPADVERLKRIATETGGQYATAQTNAALTDAFRRCLGTATNQRTIVDTTVNFKVTGKVKKITKRLGANISVAKFFVSFTPGGKLIPVIIDPNGRRHTPGAPGKNVVFRRSGTFYLFKVTHPKKGKWTVQMTPKVLVSGALAARVSVTVPRR